MVRVAALGSYPGENVVRRPPPGCVAPGDRASDTIRGFQQAYPPKLLFGGVGQKSASTPSANDAIDCLYGLPWHEDMRPHEAI